MRPAPPKVTPWKRHRAALVEAMSDVLVLVGAGAVVAAVWQLDPRAGLGVAGVGLAGLGLLLTPR